MHTELHQRTQQALPAAQPSNRQVTRWTNENQDNTSVEPWFVQLCRWAIHSRKILRLGVPAATFTATRLEVKHSRVTRLPTAGSWRRFTLALYCHANGAPKWADSQSKSLVNPKKTAPTCQRINVMSQSASAPCAACWFKKGCVCLNRSTTPWFRGACLCDHSGYLNWNQELIVWKLMDTSFEPGIGADFHSGHHNHPFEKSREVAVTAAKAAKTNWLWNVGWKRLAASFQWMRNEHRVVLE